MKKNIFFGVVLVALLVPFTARAEQEIAVSASVLPFESFSGEQKTSLGRDVAVKLLQKLSANPLIVTPAIDDLKAVIDRDESGAPSEERLREVARQLQVNFVLFGSVTTVQDAVSVDAQVFYNFPGDNYFKTFAEGPDADRAIEELARKIEQELLDKAPLIPSAQRPKVKIRKKYAAPAGEPGATDYEKAVDRELADEQEMADAEARQLKAADDPQQLEELVEDSPPKQAVPEKKKRKGSDGKDDSKSLKLDQPVNISSDSLEYSNKENTAIFRGNVVARQGDMSMFADQMEATYAGKSGEKNEKGGIKELAATGNVKIIQGDRIATGQKIVFYGDEQKIVATGNPRVWQGNNVIVGNKITVYLKQDRSVVEGTSQARVSATIQPKEKKGKKK